MKVLHVVSISFSLKYFIGNQFKYFKDKGVNFSVACSDSDDLHNYASEMEFKAFPVEISRSITPIRDLISIIKLYNFIKKEKFDIVISHTPKGGLIGVIASYLAGCNNRIYFRHGLVFETSKGIKKGLLIFIEKIVGNLATKVVNVSKSIEEMSVKLGLNSKSKNILLGKGSCNGVNIQKFSPDVSRQKDSNDLVFGFVGRLSKDKGIVELLEAWTRFNKVFNNSELWLIGPYDERDKLDESVQNQIKNDSSIKYFGEMEDVSVLYRKMDVFLLPSYREGFPTVVLEASSTGIPIITTKNTGCIDSIIEDVTGIFCELNPNNLADKMEFYAKNKNIRIQHGENGRNWIIDNFSEEFIYKQIECKILV